MAKKKISDDKLKKIILEILKSGPIAPRKLCPITTVTADRIFLIISELEKDGKIERKGSRCHKKIYLINQEIT